MRRWALFMLVSLIALPAWSLVVREGGTASVAGLLSGPETPYNDYWFDSSGNEILVVDLDAALYSQQMEDHSEEVMEMSSEAAGGESGGGCEGGSGGGGGGCGGDSEEGGCEGGSGGGPAFYLEIYAADVSLGTPICSAVKPKSPGWMKDPRLACYLEKKGDYVIRVGMRSSHEGEEMQASASASAGRTVPYLLSISLREISTSQELDEAIRQSRNILKSKDK